MSNSFLYIKAVLFQTVSSWQRKEAENTPQKQLPTRTTPITRLANTPAHAETLLHSLERAAAGIGPHVNAHKTEYMCFNQRGDLSILNGNSLKLVDKFIYLGNSVSSTETDINTRLAFLQSSGRVNTAVWMHYMDANKTYREKVWRQLHNIEQVLEAAPHKVAAVRPFTPHHEN